MGGGGQSSGPKKLNTLELQWTKTLHGMSNIRTSKVKLKKPSRPCGNKEHTTQTKLDQVYKALLESHLRYSDELWGSLSNTKLDHLQRLQTRA